MTRLVGEMTRLVGEMTRLVGRNDQVRNDQAGWAKWKNTPSSTFDKKNIMEDNLKSLTLEVGHSLRFLDLFSLLRILSNTFLIINDLCHINLLNETNCPSRVQYGKLMFMQLPLIEIDGMCLVESHAQENYLGWKYDMLGTTKKERGNILMLYEGARSFHDVAQPARWIVFQPEEKWSSFAKEATEKARKRYLPPYEKTLAENGTGFLVGDSVTIADCALFNILSYLDEMACYDNVLNDYPHCKAFVGKFSELPGVKKYLDSPRRFPPPDVAYGKEALAVLF
ncbi:putative glutathione S-transferase alpha-4 isoform X1 [Apostichopus japonicus]|uniref:Putative glutathione S-transferase alpha-4 isoform X1 n=1 Tax=Stichopus japonicus TaxID=307972 RepID=A0A2G8JFJ6_STIJA|nr:putative glutathione S-transferase alpha-4 isoform X1 [Apostichopus japonicus]